MNEEQKVSNDPIPIEEEDDEKELAPEAFNQIYGTPPYNC